MSTNHNTPKADRIQALNDKAQAMGMVIFDDAGWPDGWTAERMRQLDARSALELESWELERGRLRMWLDLKGARLGPMVENLGNSLVKLSAEARSDITGERYRLNEVIANAGSWRVA